MSVSYKSQVVAIKKEGDASADADIARNALKKQLGRKTRESVRSILLPEFASVYKVKLVKGEGSGAGKMVLNSEASAYEACRKALGRTVTFICGSESSDAVEVSPKLVSDMTKKIIDAGLDSKQFNALLTALRANITFE
jgi:hypothetical protein